MRVETIGLISRHPAYRQFLEALRSPDASRRRNAGVAFSVLGPAVLPPLVEELRKISAFYFEPNDRSPSEIARAIGVTPYPEVAVPLLIKVINTSNDWLARKETAQALIMIGHKATDAVPALLKLLNEKEDPRTRRDAAVALGAIGIPTPSIIGRLIELVDAPDVASRMGASRALGMLAVNDAHVRAALARAVNDGEVAVRIRASASLAVVENASANVIPKILTSLRATNAEARLESVLALRMLKPSPNVLDQVMIAFKKDKDLLVRRELASLLGVISEGSDKAVGLLAEALKSSSEDVRVKAAAVEALRRIGPAAKEALPALLSALKTPDAFVRETAALTLQTMGKADAVAEGLRSALYDPNPAVQIRAAVALIAVASQPSAYVNDLVTLIGSPFPEVRLIAAAMLEATGTVGNATAAPVLDAMANEKDDWIRAEAMLVLEASRLGWNPLMVRLKIIGEEPAAEIAKDSGSAIKLGQLTKALQLAAAENDPARLITSLASIVQAGTAAKDAVPLLLKLTEDDRSGVRFAALIALQQVDAASYQFISIDHLDNWSDTWRDRWQRIGIGVDKGLPIVKAWEAPTEAMLTALSEAYGDPGQAAATATHAFRVTIAKHLEPVLNAQIQAMPQELLEDKKAICDFVGETLEPLGLAVKCPKTGLPAKLKATTGHWAGIGRFHFEVYIDGKLKKPAFSDTLPQLTLIDATPHTDLERPWQEKVGPKTIRKGRNLS